MFYVTSITDKKQRCNIDKPQEVCYNDLAMSENKSLDKLKPAPQPGDELFSLSKRLLPEGTPPDALEGADAKWERMIVTEEGPVKFTKIEADEVPEFSSTWISLKRRGMPKIEAAIHHHAYEDRDRGEVVDPTDLGVFSDMIPRGDADSELSPEAKLGKVITGLDFDKQIASMQLEEILALVRDTPQEFWQTARN